MALADFLLSPSTISAINPSGPLSGDFGPLPPVSSPQLNVPLTNDYGTRYVDPQGNAVDPNAGATTAEIEVTPPPRPPPAPPLNYNNTRDVQAVQDSLAGAPRIDGGTDRGLWGMLPHQVSHGALRDVLGAVGDAFLMHAGQQPMYQNRVDQRTIGQAMAGYANNPQAAIERVMATGVPGSDKMGVDMENQYQNRQYHEAIAKQTAQYHQDQIDARNQANITRMTPYIGGLAQGATDADSYKRIWNQAEAMAQRIGSQYHAADFGLPDPEEWQPGMTGSAGMTGGQIAHNATARDSIQERRDAAGMAHADRVVSNGIRARQGGKLPTQASMLAGVKARIDAGTANDTDKQMWNRYLKGTKGAGGGGGLHSTAGGPVPNANDIAYLKAHPNVKAQFEAHFGPGSASKYMR